MIKADSKLDLFKRFKTDELLEIMFLATFKEYGGKGVGFNLCKYSIDLAKHLKSSKDQPHPLIVTALWTSKSTQRIGKKLGFNVMFQEPL